MNHQDRIEAICAGMAAEGLDLIVGIHDGTHFIETPNPVMVLSGFKSMGPAAVVLDRSGRTTLIVTPAWDAERARGRSHELEVCGADDVVEGICAALERHAARGAKSGLAGLAALPFGIAYRLVAALPGARLCDAVVFGPAAVKTADEIADAREATRIAEAGFQFLIDIVEPGMSEDELAVEVRWESKGLGAEDNFLLLCAGPHNRAVAPSNGRRLQAGDIILAEITPSYRGQLAQICRTIVLGTASDELRRKYDLVVRAMDAGIRAAVPGVPMAAVCRAINEVLEAEGYGEYCYPPHIRRRGHGLGFACNEPGDVALDNQTILKPGMVFMIHPNQYLPETGYLLCGEPVLMTEHGAEPLTAQKAALAEIEI
jgi:Xaa-Pro dipeptidase